MHKLTKITPLFRKEIWIKYKNENDLKEKIISFLDKNKRYNFWNESKLIVKNNYYYLNEKLINNKNKEFNKFLNI